MERKRGQFKNAIAKVSGYYTKRGEKLKGAKLTEEQCAAWNGVAKIGGHEETCVIVDDVIVDDVIVDDVIVDDVIVDDVVSIEVEKESPTTTKKSKGSKKGKSAIGGVKTPFNLR